MANFLYFHPSDNVAPNATVTTSGTEDSAYPLTNAVDLSYAKLAAPGKITGATGAFILDFGSAQRVDYVVLQHNFDPALAVAVQMNASNAWGAPTVATSPTVPAKRADGYTKKLGVDLRSVSGYSTGGFRYLRINVSGTNSAAIGLKVQAFSAVRTLSRNVNWGVEIAEHQTGIDMLTDALVPWAYDFGAAPRVLVGDVDATDADALAIREWFRACGGRAKVTTIVLDPADPDPIVGRWSEGAAPSAGAVGAKALRLVDRHEFLDLHPAMRIAIEEITAGDPEWD